MIFVSLQGFSVKNYNFAKDKNQTFSMIFGSKKRKIKSITHNGRHSNNLTKIENIKLLTVAFIIGLVAGAVGALFRIILSHIEEIRTLLFTWAHNQSFSVWIIPVLFSVIGVIIALYLVKKYAPETSGSGIQEIEGALDEVRPIRWKRVLPVKFFASLFSLGGGLLLGREGPTVQLGANVGKMIKDLFRLPDHENNPLISAGAAAGLASAFNAPFAGIIFVIEEMHDHFKFNFYSVAAIMIGSATSDLVVRAMISPKPVIAMNVYSSPHLSAILLFILLGLFFSFIGYAFNKSLIFTMDLFQDRWNPPIVVMGVFAGLVIAVVGIAYPHIIGGGYPLIQQVLNRNFSLIFLLFLFVVRFILTIFSYSTGVPGGIFAPLMTLGIIFGMVFGEITQHYFPDIVPDIGVFAIAGMAAIFSSTVIAPLTGLVLAVEMTANYELILPLILTTATASVVTRLMGNEPIYTTLLKRTLEREKRLKEQEKKGS